MHGFTRALSIGAIALTFALAGCASAGQGPGSPTASEAGATANAADEMFASMMIPHHQQAVEMADTMLGKDGADEAVLDLAQRIRDAQQPEIELMQGWLEAWGVEAGDAGHGGHGGAGGDGMMSEEDMAALEQAEGAEASRLFLEQMIVHHQGAVEMAEAELDGGQHPDALELAQQVIDAQTAEIAEMQELLAAL